MRAWVPTAIWVSPVRSDSRAAARSFPLRAEVRKRDAVGRARQQPAEGQEVLFGQDLRGGHERGLGTVFHRHHHGQESHQGLARAHVALHEAVHGVRRAHVVGDLPEHALLGAREGKGQDLLHRLPRLWRDLEGRALAAHPQRGLARGEAELEQEELLEDQSEMSRIAGRVQERLLRSFRRMVDPLQGLAPGHDSEAQAHVFRQRVGKRLGQVDDDAGPAPAEGPCP